MIINYILELLVGGVKLLLHPMFYIFLFLLYWNVVKRLKRERRQFHTRVYGGIADIFQTLVVSVLFGIIFSIVFISLGIQLPLGVIVLLGVSYLFFSIFMRLKWLHPVYVFTVTVLLVKVLPNLETGWHFFDQLMVDISDTSISTLGLVLGMLLLQEGLLLRLFGAKMTSPILLKSKRGQVVGGHESIKLWIIPLFLFIPGGELGTIPSWPLLLSEQATYSLLLVPFAIGFHQLITYTLPIVEIKRLGNETIYLSFVVIIGSGLAIWLAIPLIAYIGIAIALIAREIILFASSIRNSNHTSIFTERSEGVKVLGVLPDSPAEKMGIVIGEIITKVNGRVITKPDDFYYAIQINAAFCKLEVLDANLEPRIAQRSLYENEHHELGILFVEQSDVIDNKVG